MQSPPFPRYLVPSSSKFSSTPYSQTPSAWEYGVEENKMLYYLHWTLFWIIVHLRGGSNSGVQNGGCVTRHCGGQHTTPISPPGTLSPACPLISTPNLQYIIRNESNFNGTVTIFLRDPFYSKRHIAFVTNAVEYWTQDAFYGPCFSFLLRQTKLYVFWMCRD